MNRSLSLTIAALFAVLHVCPGPAGATSRAGVANFYSRNSQETLIQLYEDPSRQEWQKPLQVVERLSIQPGEVVADIGAGTGYFSILLAKEVGRHGTVYAVDIDRNMTEYLNLRVKKEGLANVRAILAKEDDPLLAKESTDLVFTCNTYMFIQDRVRYLSRLKDVLKKNGRLAIISYNQVDSPEGPPIQTRVSREDTVREAVEAGFLLDAEYFFLPYQHFLIFKKR